MVILTRFNSRPKSSDDDRYPKELNKFIEKLEGRSNDSVEVCEE